MKNYSDCYVAVIDLLGFKRIVEKAECDNIASLFDVINTEFKMIKNGVTLVDPQIVKMKVMSDTICFYIESSCDDSLAKLIIACSYFQTKLMRFNPPILSRGAIVKDYLYSQDNVIFGPGLVKAYLLEEKTAVTPRIIFNQSLIDDISSKTTELSDEVFNARVYRDNDLFCCVNSLSLFYELDGKKASWKIFENCVKNVLDNEYDVNIRNKYLYINSCISKIQKRLISSDIY